jgi:hypothetical protein
MNELDRLSLEAIAISLRESENTLSGNKDFIQLRYLIVKCIFEADRLIEEIAE